MPSRAQGIMLPTPTHQVIIPEPTHQVIEVEPLSREVLREAPGQPYVTIERRDLTEQRLRGTHEPQGRPSPLPSRRQSTRQQR